jgi:hypothetical protein
MKKVLKKTLKSTAQNSLGWIESKASFFMIMMSKSFEFGTFSDRPKAWYLRG